MTILTCLRPLFLSLSLLLIAQAGIANAQDDSQQDTGGDPWVAYASTGAIAGLGIFIICKSARRS